MKMKIGGFVKQSLIDYPGKVASVIFTRGCNFRCGYCHNPYLVLPELFDKNTLVLKDEIFRYLQERKSWLEAVVVTGGEPTIHNDLPEFLKQIREFGYKVKLDTNGSNPEMLQIILAKKLVDYIAMDIKTVLRPEEYSKITGIQDKEAIVENVISSMKLIREAPINFEFRTTNIPGTDTEAIVESISKIVGNIGSYKLNDFQEGLTINKYIQT